MRKNFYTTPITLLILTLNIAATIVVINNSELLIGDLMGFKSETVVIIQSLIYISLSLLFLSVLYNGLEKIKPLTTKLADSNSRPIAIFLICLELLYITYVFNTGLFVGGNNERGGGVISALFVLLNVDVLVLIFLTHVKTSKYKPIIIMLWIISFLQRGWISYFFILILISFIDRRLKNKKNWKAGVVLICFILALPFVEQIKNSIRSGEAISTQLTFFDYADSFNQQFMKVVGRVQTVSHVAFITDNINQLQNLKNNGESTDFFEENFIYIIAKKLGSADDKINTPDLLARYISPSLDSSWNVNPSLIGWIFIQNDLYVLPIIWVVLLCFLFTMLSKIIANDLYAMNMRWLFWLVFLFPGWIFQFTAVIFSLLVFILLKYTLRTKRVKPL
ncbi:O7 family O-antigen polymerase [Escherichia coli]|uniref:O7 family O-antigen polymerase n=1 Tax=Escherichia coli TaxID=562 RepID=UPI002808E7D0|nr:O7 family O-antigen polymerase [Escherichia coli]MDQ8060055.1 O7 family O-antigen polymerase [Escherichia coli]